MTTKMKLHNGVYYAPADLKEQLAREAADAKAKETADAVKSVAESGVIEEGSEKIAALEGAVKNLTELLDSIIEAFGERLELLEAKSEGRETSEGDGGDAAGGAEPEKQPELKPEPEPEPEKPKTPRAAKAAKA